MHPDTIAALAVQAHADRLRAARDRRIVREVRSNRFDRLRPALPPPNRGAAREALAFSLIEAGLRLLAPPSHSARRARS